MSGSKPRVLLVDDHRQVLDAVSVMLTAHGFDVVGAAIDGQRAVDLARHTKPDVIVLDVDMPLMDGFQTVRALKESGVTAIPIVFLSMHDARDIVREAFRCGGLGYVIKSRVGRDLVRALEQALAGRMFVPSLETLFQLTEKSAHSLHAMQVHSRVDPAIDSLAAFFDLALRRGDATCVIATDDVRDGLAERLRARGWNAGGVCGHERYLIIDETAALNRIMRNGLPDRDRLSEIAVELNQYRLAVSGPSSRLLMFGDMVVALSRQGNTRAMVELEHFWNELTHGLPFTTLCGYTTSCFHDGVPHLWADACAEHVAIGHCSDV